jgi:ATPase family associated with various cellular activities (AAA)
MTLSLIEQWKRARGAGVPILGIETSDIWATMNEIHNATVEGKGAGTAIFSWDIIRGIKARTPAAKQALNRLCDGQDPASMQNPTEMLVAVARCDERAIMFMLNAHLYLRGDNAAGVVQGIANVRDEFKGKGATLVLLGSAMPIPAELAQDIMVLNDPLPNDAQLGKIIVETCTDAGVEVPKGRDLEKLVDILVGMSAFSAEQTLATCIARDDAGNRAIDTDELWQKKCVVIAQTPGLSVYQGQDRVEDLKDLDNLVAYLLRIIPDYNGTCFVDEIEKQFAGNAGDSSGVSQDIHGQWLSWMEDNPETDGIILIGHPGTGKSAIAKAIGNKAGIPTIIVDPNGMKSKYIGESGTNTRKAFRVIDAITRGKTLVIATCNSIEAISPELKRRFTLGVFFVDLLSKEGRDACWGHYGEVYAVPTEHTFDDTGWTGAEIKQCCRLAMKMGVSVDDAARKIVPVARASKERIEALRNQASGNFVSAKYDGVYVKGEDELPDRPTKRRMFDTSDMN